MGSKRAIRTDSTGGVTIQIQKEMMIERLIVSILIMLIVGAMSVLSPPSAYTLFPLIFGIVSVIGYNLMIFFVFDSGIFLSVISYMFVSSGLVPSLENLVVIAGLFFLLIGIWFYGRNIIFISGIEKKGESKVGLSEFRKSSLNEILNILLPGLVLSLLGFVLVFYSTLGLEVGNLLKILLMVGFSGAVFLITSLIIRMLSSENIKSGKKS